MSEQLSYVYGIVPASFEGADAPRGLDDRVVRVEREGAVGALVSELDADVYAGGTAEANAGDVGWIGPRAIAHDAVLTWASERGGVIPFPMFTLFANVAGVHTMLRERAATFVATLDRVAAAEEYTLRVFRLDAAFRGALAQLSPKLAELEQQAAAATPGQRYLLQRKLDEEKKTELRRVSDEIAATIYEKLATLSGAGVRDQLPPAREGDGPGRAILNASFLVPRDRKQTFQEAVNTLLQQYEPRGFRFELTGPWPPYHFVHERSA
jgi:hypothetical protein